MHSSTWLNSVFSVRKNLRRAGVLKNKSRTSTVVPTGCAAGVTEATISRPSATTDHALLLPSAQDVSVNLETELILASASPRNPKLPTAFRIFAGLSTTSPAAIWFARRGDNKLIFAIFSSRLGDQ